MTAIQAYRRPNGSVGIRNHVVVIPTSICASEVAVRVSGRVEATTALPHQHGCCQLGADYTQTVRTLIGLGRNGNVGAVLVVSLGCEGVQASELVEGLRETGKPVESIQIQSVGNLGRTIEEGASLLEGLKERAAAEREECDLSEIVLGMECGGSDATSGLAANPAVGVASDLLVEEGGTSILSETTELIGAEHVLARRARDEAVANRLIEVVQRTESRAIGQGTDLRGSQPTPGNIEGGLTTIEEKSLGCIYKAGTAPIEGVLEYAETPPGTGLYVMDTPGQDIESITGMVAGGAQIVVFTTGRGTPTGCPVAPVIKITGNSGTFGRMSDSMDVDAGKVIDGGVSMADMGRHIFDELVAVCGGKHTRSEINGHREFAIYRVGFTF